MLTEQIHRELAKLDQIASELRRSSFTADVGDRLDVAVDELEQAIREALRTAAKRP